MMEMGHSPRLASNSTGMKPIFTMEGEHMLLPSFSSSSVCWTGSPMCT